MNRCAAFKLITFLFLFNLLIWPATAQTPDAGLTEKIRPAVVTITTYNDKGEIIRQASGFFIDREGRLLASRHTLKGAARAEARTGDGKTYQIKTVIAENRDLDLVQLGVCSTPGEVPFLTLSKTLATSGQTVFIVAPQDTIRATVANVRQLGETGRNFEFSANLTALADGSPVVNEKGEVIGIATQQVVQDEMLNLGIAVSGAMMITERLRALGDWSVGLGAEPAVAIDGLFFAGLDRVFNADYVKAIPLLERAAQRNAGDAEVRLYCGFAKAKLKRFEEAMQDYREAARLAPDFVDALNNLGAMYDKLGRFKEALEVYKQAIKLKPDFALAHNNLGSAYAHLGRYKDAIAAFQQGLVYDARLAEIHLNLGAIYYKLGDQQNALESLQKAIQIRPGYAEAHNYLGNVLTKLGRAQEAGEYFEKAAALKPDLAEARFNLGVYHVIFGNSDAAFEAYGALKRLNQSLANRLYTFIEKSYTIAAAASRESAADRTDAGPTTASQATIMRLIDKIKGMMSKGTLRREAADGLIAELQIASQQPDTDNAIIKINLLNGFIERVGDLINQQALPVEDGQRLIDAISMIINRISG